MPCAILDPRLRQSGDAILSSEKARQLYEARLKEQRDSYARERGAVKTREHEIATNALSMGMSIDDIIKLTGLARDEVESLQAN